MTTDASTERTGTVSEVPAVLSREHPLPIVQRRLIKVEVESLDGAGGCRAYTSDYGPPTMPGRLRRILRHRQRVAVRSLVHSWRCRLDLMAGDRAIAAGGRLEVDDSRRVSVSGGGW
jgi:hypothetical protein